MYATSLSRYTGVVVKIAPSKVRSVFINHLHEAHSDVGPSYKRGPPKGYISAIEQRLHQVEAILGAIINSKDTKSQETISALRTDDIAREIIDRVDRGPYGSPSRTASAGPADFSATIRQLNESRENRAARDSRVSRENLSTSYRQFSFYSIAAFY